MSSIKIKPSLKKNPDVFPLNQKNQHQSHLKANELEKQRYGKRNFNVLYKLGQSLRNDELLGHINKKGDIFISKKVPKNLRSEVIYHERAEYTFIREK